MGTSPGGTETSAPVYRPLLVPMRRMGTSPGGTEISAPVYRPLWFPCAAWEPVFLITWGSQISIPGITPS
ncbi:MAG: hypothetical protein GY862_08200, partial [Gammaproteobacteria bacterium]|nr:hypothetical protein [Gammaproteobacteria bacterium]